jgi:flavin-dependent dehydrogenase
MFGMVIKIKVVKMKYDVAVIGGGPGGIPAALAAARNGTKVLIIERLGYLGGNAASGLPLLGFLDKSGRQVVGGIAQEFVDRLIELGGAYGHSRCPLHNSVTVIQPDLFKLVAFEKCRDADVNLLLHCELTHVNIENRRISRVTVVGKGMQIDIEADVFVDATGDGDVAYLGGASYQKGKVGTR